MDFLLSMAINLNGGGRERILFIQSQILTIKKNLMTKRMHMNYITGEKG